EVVGVIPRALEERELGHQAIHELVVVDDMHQRKATMAERAQAFVALPGGYGTLEELFEAVAWAQLDFHRKPVALLNTLGYFDRLLAFLDHAVEQGFLRPHHRPLIRVETRIDALLDGIVETISPS
ncbi:MAG: TIGR00730 family Rossman fold protein, partial [Gemmatimonadetes bacterium]|nr:TIGR00730 family Rossman fold protein [Gemmatimonadota bacterium]